MHLDIPPLPETGYLRLPAVLKLIPVGRSTWHRWVNTGKAPQPVKLGPMIAAWRVEDIRLFIEQLAQEVEQ